MVIWLYNTFKLNDRFINFCVFFLHVLKCTIRVFGALEGQKRALDALKRGLQMVLNYNVGAGD